MLFGLLTLGSSVGRKLKQSDAVIVHPWSGGHSTPKKSVSHHAAAQTNAAKTTPAKVNRHPPRVQTPKTPDAPSPIIEMSSDDFAASNISKLSSHTAGTGKASGKGSGSTYGPGQGPGGANLYNAEWYEEPSQGTLAYYLPHGAPPDSWAIIACQTAAHYHVENCVGISESPPGSGLKNALRQASWQFLVRPPNLDGRPLIGSWVKIRFDWTEREPK